MFESAVAFLQTYLERNLILFRLNYVYSKGMVVHDFPLTGISAIAIALGGSHSCVAETSGGIKCWGLNAHGQLGTGGSSWVQQLRPVDVGNWQGMQRWGHWGKILVVPTRVQSYQGEDMSNIEDMRHMKHNGVRGRLMQTQGRGACRSG
jgi:hypothetical protein